MDNDVHEAQHRRHEYDAIVVGARAAGAATAMLLGRAGRRVLLVDRVRVRRRHALDARAVARRCAAAAPVGSARRRSARGTPPIRRPVSTTATTSSTSSIRPEHGVDALYAPRRTVLDRSSSTPHGTRASRSCTGCASPDLLRGRDGRVSGIAARTPARRDVAAAPIVIGADGVGSDDRAARRQRRPCTRRRRRARSSTGTSRVLGRDAYDWYFRPGVSAGVIPTNGGLANVFVGLPPPGFRATSRERRRNRVPCRRLHAASPAVARQLDGHRA